MNLLSYFGKYVLFLKSMFNRPENLRMYWRETIRQMNIIGVESIPIVAVVALFIGGVTAVQFAYQVKDFLVPVYYIGFIVRDTMIIEMAPTVSCMILAGKVGSNMSSELGNMRITEQIDALEVMGVNSLNYLVFPKIIALLTYPFLIAIAMFLGIFGGLIAGVYGGFVSLDEFIRGLQEDFIPFHLVYAFVKTYVFAFILATVPAWHGYYMKGGALEVGKASTKSFVWTSVLIILANYIITQLLLS